MAHVYLAEDLKRSGKVALRVLRTEVAALAGARRFLGEIEALKGLDHPNIPKVLDCGEVDGFVFYVVPQMSGETLRDRLRRITRFPVAEAVSIVVALAGALDHAHRLGFLHGDLKPANVIFHDGWPMLSAFGMVPALGAAGSRITETDLSVGTPYYMSPERAIGEGAVGVPTEMYALGCILYEMLVGSPPFVGPSAQAVLGEVVISRPVAPMQRRAQVPANVDAAVRRALEKAPAERFASGSDFVEALTDPRFQHEDRTSTISPEPVTLETGHSAWGRNGSRPSSDGGTGPWPATSGAGVASDVVLYADRLLVKEDESIRFIHVDAIRFVESEKNYLRIHTDTSDYLVRRRIGELETQLDPKRFKRIHRSTIVNLDSVDRLVPWFSGGYLVHLRSGEELKLSRGYANKLFGQVGKTL